MPRPGSSGQREAGGGHEAWPRCPRSLPDEVDRRPRRGPRATRASAIGEAGQHVAGGAAAGDDGEGRRVGAISARPADRAAARGQLGLAGDVQQQAGGGHG